MTSPPDDSGAQSDWGVDLPIDEEGDGEQPALRKKRGDATLRQLVDEVELWRGSDGHGYGTVDVNGHREHHRVMGEGFANWLRLRAQLRNGSMLGNSEVDRLCANLNARCLGLGEVYPICHRVGRHGDKLYVDLADDKWRAVEIVPAHADTADRWRVVDTPPVRFVRTSGMREMPAPVPGGTVDDLRRWINVETEAHFRLTVAWLISCYRDRGPYPMLIISSGQGSGKSTLTRLLTRLTDPQRADVRAPPREERDLWVAAQHARLLAYDNLSSVPASLADAFCRISTGGAFATRTLHSDEDETILRACGPVLLNSITDIVHRADMADRSLFIQTRRLADGERRTEDEFWFDFTHEEPLLLGALFDAVSASLGAYDATPVPTKLRMADAARSAAAACPFLNWQSAELLEWWRHNRMAGDLAVIESDMVAGVLVMLLEEQQSGRWEGSVTQLYTQLSEAAPDRLRKAKAWPGTPFKLRAHLTRLQDPLETKGWAFQVSKGTHGSRKLTFRRTGSADTGDAPDGSPKVRP